MQVTVTQSAGSTAPLRYGFVYYAPKDGNRDGFVSTAEQADWARTHPEQELLKQLRAPRPAPARPKAPTAQVDAPTRRPSAFLDPRDRNQDGVVSPAERMAYAQTHPAEDLLRPSASSRYTRQGTLKAGTGPSLFDRYA